MIVDVGSSPTAGTVCASFLPPQIGCITTRKASCKAKPLDWLLYVYHEDIIHRICSCYQHCRISSVDQFIFGTRYSRRRYQAFVSVLIPVESS